MVKQEARAEEVRILRVEDHCIELEKDAVEKILLDRRIRDKHVAVISLAGDFRKGKSFMLSFFLRFLNNLGNPVWLGGPDEPLRGFAWRGGCDRHTTGILIWKEVFLVKTPQGEELAVLLMDTQGMHDDQSTVKECASIFALTTMLSSVLVFNISQNLQENDLQYLQLFTEYGRLVEQQMFGKPFQKLLFLVRDWYHIDDAEFGATGGRKLLEKRLKVHEIRPKQLQQPRKHIHDCFTDVDCFLMPHPGLKVAQMTSFDGRLSDISEDFKEQLMHFVPSILSPEKLIPKEINGEKLTCHQLFIYMTTYVEKFKRGDLPEPKTVFEATAEGNHLTAMFKALNQYRTSMEKRCGGKRVTWQKFNKIHNQECDRAKETFVDTRKMGGEELSKIYQQRLLQEIDKWYTCFSCGMTKKCLLETTCCKALEGGSAAVLTVGAAACFVGGLPVAGLCCAIAAGVGLGALTVSFVYGFCVGGSSQHAIHADRPPSKEVPSKGQHFQSDTLYTDFHRQCVNEIPKEMDGAFKNSNQNASKMHSGSGALARISSNFKKSSNPYRRLKES